MRKTIRALWPEVWIHRRGMALGLGALVIKDILGASLPLVIRAGVDSLNAGFRMEHLLWLAGAMLALSAMKGFFQYQMRVIMIGISRDIEYSLRNRLFAHLVRLDLKFYQRYRTGDIMARSTNDLNAVRMMLGPGIMYWTETTLTFALAVTVMAWTDWRLTLVALLPAPLVSFAVIKFGRQIHARFEKIQALFSDISSRVQENLAGVRVIRAYTQEQAEIDRFEHLNRDYIRQNLRLGVTSGLFMPMLESLIGMAFLIVLFVGGRRLLAGEITIGSFLMFNVYMGMLGWPMIAMGWVVNLMQRGTASLDRLNQLMEEKPAIAAPPSPRPLPEQVRGEIAFEAVHVDYASAKALNGVSLRIPAGSTVAIVGHTGSGKTTLVQLIPRLLDPTAGRVLLDGLDLRDVDPEHSAARSVSFPRRRSCSVRRWPKTSRLACPRHRASRSMRAAAIAGLSADIAGFPTAWTRRSASAASR